MFQAVIIGGSLCEWEGASWGWQGLGGSWALMLNKSKTKTTRKQEGMEVLWEIPDVLCSVFMGSVCQ